jgi:hypothetical protein
MTLLAHDEADIVDAQIAFHLNAGVDFVIATDHRSTDGTREILESYARAGCLHLISEVGEDFHQAEWVTRMARLAATDFGADWVINTDADEFWWPREAPLKAILAEVPRRFGTVRGLLRNFVPTSGEDGGGPFFERLTVRVAPRELVPTSPFRVQEKVVHRAHPEVSVPLGNHDAFADGLVDLRGWYPIEILHFPIRSLEQCIRKQGAHVDRAIRQPELGHMAGLHEAHTALRAGAVREYYESLAVDESRLREGLADGSLTVDTRLRDVLRGLESTERHTSDDRAFLLHPLQARPLRFETPTLEEDGRFAGEITVGAEWESTAKIQAKVDQLRERVHAVEDGVWARTRRRAQRRVFSLADAGAG